MLKEKYVEVEDDLVTIKSGCQVKLPHDRIVIESWNIRHLIGELLTIIDGSVEGERQNKAIKDLITATLWRFYNNNCDNQHKNGFYLLDNRDAGQDVLAT